MLVLKIIPSVEDWSIMFHMNTKAWRTNNKGFKALLPNKVFEGGVAAVTLTFHSGFLVGCHRTSSTVQKQTLESHTYLKYI